MAYTTLSFFGERVHLLERPDDDSACPDCLSHARLSPGNVRLGRRDPLLMARMRQFVSRLGGNQTVYQLSDTEVVRQFTRYLEDGRLRAVQCGALARGAASGVGGAGSGGGSGAGAGAGAGSAADGGSAHDSSSSGAAAGLNRGKDDFQIPHAAPTKTWVEFELLDWDGTPAAFERYEIRLPDGSVQDGRLDGKGRARFSGIDPGNCQVSFPDFDAKEWKAK